MTLLCSVCIQNIVGAHADGLQYMQLHMDQVESMQGSMVYAHAEKRGEVTISIQATWP